MVTMIRQTQETDSSRPYPLRDVKDQDNWENHHIDKRRRALLFHFAHWCPCRPDSWQADTNGFIGCKRKLSDNVKFTFFFYCCLEKFNRCRKMTQMTFISILSSVIININTLLKFRVESMKRLFPERVVNHSNRLARKVVRVPKLSALRKYLDSVLGYRFN